MIRPLSLFYDTQKVETEGKNNAHKERRAINAEETELWRVALLTAAGPRWPARFAARRTPCCLAFVGRTALTWGQERLQDSASVAGIFPEPASQKKLQNKTKQNDDPQSEKRTHCTQKGKSDVLKVYLEKASGS